jgi:hypothetical protein
MLPGNERFCVTLLPFHFFSSPSLFFGDFHLIALSLLDALYELLEQQGLNTCKSLLKNTL